VAREALSHEESDVTAKVPINRFEGRQRERARRVLGRVRTHLELAEIPYLFAGDFHLMVPERSPL
jgi:hypothetical protein